MYCMVVLIKCCKGVSFLDWEGVRLKGVEVCTSESLVYWLIQYITRWGSLTQVLMSLTQVRAKFWKIVTPVVLVTETWIQEMLAHLKSWIRHSCQPATISSPAWQLSDIHRHSFKMKKNGWQLIQVFSIFDQKHQKIYTRQIQM